MMVFVWRASRGAILADGAVSAGMLAVMWGVSAALDLDKLSAVAAVLTFYVVFATMLKAAFPVGRLTITKARARLDEIEKGSA